MMVVAWLLVVKLLRSSVARRSERPGVGDDNKNIVLLKLRPVDNNVMVEKADDSACTVECSVRLELGILPFSHLLATHHPRVHVDREDYEDLELV
jgi:hypothetical protein